jgi:hypothetical protein
MLPAKTPALLLLGWVAICSPVFTQNRAASKPRELSIAGTDGQPSFSLRIWAEGQKGLVAVRDEKGTEVQKLVCPSCAMLRKRQRRSWRRCANNL